MRIPFQKYLPLLFLFITIIVSCSKGGSNEPEEKKLLLPEKPVAVLPANAETCSDFDPVPGETDKATISFSWTAAENASSYLVEVFESDTSVSSTTTTSLSTELTLEKGKSYSWTVTARNNDGVAQSNTSSFTTPGVPTGNFAPYAAEIIMDFDSSSGALLISWIGSDEDGDTLTFDVILKEDDSIISEHEDTDNLQLDLITTSPGTTYLVQVKSIDSFGNYSISTSSLKIAD